MSRARFSCWSSLILLKQSKVLLLKRSHNAVIFPNQWHFPGGKLEDEESPKDAVIREAYEEIGVSIDPLLSSVLYSRGPSFEGSGQWQDVSLFFVLENFTGEAYNKDIKSHTDMGWFDIDKLPANIMHLCQVGIYQHFNKINYGEFIYSSQDEASAVANMRYSRLDS